jgi:hypothetical protein
VFISPAGARIGSRARVGDSFERLKPFWPPKQSRLPPKTRAGRGFVTGFFSEFRDALDGVRRARFRLPELPQQMPTDFLRIGDRALDLPVDGHFENALWFVAESSVTRVTDAVRLEIQRSGEERHPR